MIDRRRLASFCDLTSQADKGVSPIANELIGALKNA